MPMLWTMIMAAQSIPAAPPPRPVFGPSLPQVTKATASCAPTDDGDIVVCGKTDPDQYRVRALPPPPNGKPLPPMTAKVGNGTVDGRAVQKCVGGFCAPAAMVTLKLPF